MSNEQYLRKEHRFELLFNEWDALHNFKCFDDVRSYLQNMPSNHHQWIVHFVAANLNSCPDPTLSIGAAKTMFWDMVNSH